MQVTNGNLSLHVAEDGDPSAPPILLLHGITSFGRTWDWIVPALAERFRVLRLDFRGHGQSDRAPGEYTAPGYVTDAVAALEQAAGQPCVVIGHSLGGATAAALTQQHPHLLTGAIMEDPPLGPTSASEVMSLEGNALLDGFRMMRQSIPMLQDSNIPLETLVGVLSAAPDTTGAATFGDKLHADGIATMAGSLLEVDATVLDPVLNGSIEAFLDPAVPFGVPSLILAADPSKPDAVASPASAEHYVDISADVELLIVEGAGHLIHDELASREVLRQAVFNFLDRVAPA
jgi:pimeloyl-ACP methyl ester carboxylesterase